MIETYNTTNSLAYTNGIASTIQYLPQSIEEKYSMKITGWK